MSELVVPSRFCGPPSSGNGGWTAGALAALARPAGAGSAVSVSLRQPPPLDVAMSVDTVEGVTTATYDGAAVATAEAADDDLALVDPVPAEVARAAEAAFPGFGAHPFPTCFVCGTDRRREMGCGSSRDRVEEQDGAVRLAATWVPDASLADDPVAATWAALDCIGGWAGGLADRPMVLARMTARVDTLPVLGEPHVVVGLARGQEGRKQLHRRRRCTTPTAAWSPARSTCG